MHAHRETRALVGDASARQVLRLRSMGRAIGWDDFFALGEGALGGAVGTAAFTGWMKGAQRAGLLGELPPRTIARDALQAAVGRPSSKTVDIATAVTHLGFGVATGAVFGVVARHVHTRIPGALQGAMWGSLVWAASYAGWVPALDILPAPHRDRPDRPWVTFIGHLIFGGLLGAIAARKKR
jgi:uncharacterized membrane protein YagU involved in acid resistance